MENDYLKQIDRILQRINTHPEYSSCIERRTNEAIRQGAFRHSLELELQEHHRTKYAERNAKKYVGFLSEAWNYLSTHGLDLASLSVLGGIVEPISNPGKRFRFSDVQIGEVPPSDPEKIIYEVKYLLEDLESVDLHPVVRASEAHLRLAGIHPYEDGNGRVARLVQNFCLAQRGYPAAVINYEDKSEYKRVLRDSLKSRYNGQSNFFSPNEADRNFRDFIAKRVLESSIILDKELQNKRIYEVSLFGVNSPSSAHSLANIIRGNAKQQGHGVKINVQKTNGFNGKKIGNKGKHGALLKIVGDISLENLESLIKRASKNQHLKYNIKNLRSC